MVPAANSEVIKVRDLVVDFESHRVLNGVNVELHRGEILGFVGASGAGKSTLARTIIGLLPKRAGRIEILGVDIDKASHEQKRAIDRRWGVLFQQGALFSSLTVGKNIEFPIREYLRLSNRLTTEMAIAKLEMVGLSPDVYREYPSELSGGMIKRAALARALALDPEILFLDEPTSGLDPISAGEFDALILTLQQTLGISVLMVTHDLDSLHRVCDRIAVLGDGKIIAAGTMDKMLESKHPWLMSYFHGDRAHADWHVRVKG
jgi:phospholipid/cholesterol/gamma-HCH transport system ATP-binding protein